MNRVHHEYVLLVVMYAWVVPDCHNIAVVGGSLNLRSRIEGRTMTSSKSLRIPYTLESQDLSLPAFVSSYGRAFPQAAIVTQGYCPVDGEEDSEEFSSGEECM